MPYVRCARCGLTSFTVAGWSHVDHCPRCGNALSRESAPATARHDRHERTSSRPSTERSRHGPYRTTH